MTSGAAERMVWRDGDFEIIQPPEAKEFDEAQHPRDDSYVWAEGDVEIVSRKEDSMRKEYGVFGVRRPIRIVGRDKDWDESQHPRDDAGKFTSDGGSESGDGSMPGDMHPENLNYIPRGPFREVASAEEALKAIQRGEYVKLRADQVGTVLSKMAEIASDAKAKGEKAPTYDLCQVSVPDTNVFCEDNKGIPRADMPQIDDKPAFKEYLRNAGLSFETLHVPSNELKATQAELDGATVGGMIKGAEAGTYNPRGDTIFVSSDNFVLDGHHRWAATVGMDYTDDKQAQGLTMQVTRVNLPIMALLPVANKFNEETGVTKRAFGADMMTAEEFAKLREGGNKGMRIVGR